MSDEPRNLPEDFYSQGGDPNQPPQSSPYGQQDPYAAPQYGQQDPHGQAPYGQDPYSQQPYGQPDPGQQPYGQPGYGAGGWPAYGAAVAPPHPNASTSMVLGIIGLVGIMLCCGVTLILSPFAWMMGGKAVKEIDANPQQYGGREQARAGQVMGIIGTALLALGILALVAFFAFAVVSAEEFSDNMNDPVLIEEDNGF